MKAGELRELAVSEIKQKTLETKNDLFNAKIKQATGQLEDTAKLSRLRREIARLETVLLEKQEATK
jgi:large subunit ribosomal protein L29